MGSSNTPSMVRDYGRDLLRGLRDASDIAWSQGRIVLVYDVDSERGSQLETRLVDFCRSVGIHLPPIECSLRITTITEEIGRRIIDLERFSMACQAAYRLGRVPILLIDLEWAGVDFLPSTGWQVISLPVSYLAN